MTVILVRRWLKGTTTQPNSALSELRRLTRADHAALDAQLDITNPGLTTTGFADAMVALHAGLQTWPVEGFSWWDHDELLTAAAEDCRALGRVPLPIPAGQRRSKAERLGLAYVWCGSTLGARHLLPHLRRALGGDAAIGYFTLASGRATLWPRLVSVLANELGDTTDRRAAAVSARRVFDGLGQLHRLAKEHRGESAA